MVNSDVCIICIHGQWRREPLDDLVPINCGFGFVSAKSRVAGEGELLLGEYMAVIRNLENLFICFDMIAFMQQLGQELLM